MSTASSGTGYCDGISRRRAIKIGGTGMLGGLSLPHLLAMADQAPAALPGKAKACIFLLLEGGPSHIDMWDLKPNAPSEIRGPFNPISTNVPGTLIGELMPRCAKVADKFTMVRSATLGDGAHQTGVHWLLTGYPPNFADGQAKKVPANELYPSLGSVISRELGPRGAVPPYICVPNQSVAGGPGFYGPSYAPFVIETDPVEPDFEVRDLNLAKTAIDEKRFDRRRRMLQRIDQLGSKGLLADGKNTPGLSGRSAIMSTYYEKAFSMVTSPQAKKAFNIHEEPEALRERYGYHQLGQCALLARRLVEAGCRFISVEHGSWDTHFDNFTGHEVLAPSADSALAALVTDLDERGMLDETLVVMVGEMGRTPKINKNAGRDHHILQTAIFAGGGVKRGALIGGSDATAAAPTTAPMTNHSFLGTIFHLMGVDYNKLVYTDVGRPVSIVNGGQVFEELLA